jgi:hypothetical protein
MTKLARIGCNEHEIVTIYDWWFILTVYKLLRWVFEMVSLMMWWWAWSLAKTSILASLNTKASVTMCDSHIRYSQSQSQYHVINERCYRLLSLSVCGVVGVLLVAKQLCYLCCVCAVRSEMYLFLNLYFRRIRMSCKCVKSVDNFCYRYGEIIFTKKKKWTVEYPNISLATRPLSLCECVTFSRNSQFFPYTWWGRRNVPQETLWPSTSRDLEFLFNIYWTTDRTSWPHQGPKNIEE